MITVALLIAAMTADVPSKAEACANFKASANGYRDCVRSKAVLFERAREPVLDTVTAAFSACADERAEHIFAMLDVRKAAGEADPSISKADAQIKSLIDEGLRNELIAELMAKRAASR